MKKRVTIIDTFGFFFRSYYALPPLRSAKGFPTGLLTGFMTLIDSLVKEHQSDYLLFALDSKGKTFRHEIDASYKGNRKEAPEELTKQLPIAIEWIEEMGFSALASDGFEADDIIATVSALAVKKGFKVRIISHDKDLYQMIEDGKVEMYDAVKKKLITEQSCIDKFGVTPKDFINFQAILGDSSDNIKGVKGIGKVGASKLINQYHTLEAIYADIDNCGTPRIQTLLKKSKEEAYLSRELVTMRQDVFKDIDIEAFLVEDKNYLTPLIEAFEYYEMRGALKKAQEGLKSDEREIKKNSLTFEAITLETKEKLDAILESLEKKQIIAFDTETKGLDTKKDEIVGFSFALDKNRAYYVPIAHNYLGVEEQVELEDALSAIRVIFSHKVIGQNLKFDLAMLANQYHIEPITPYGDTMILAWLMNPSSKVGLDSLAKKYFDYEMKSFKEMVKKGEDFSFVSIEEATFYAGEDAWMSFLLYEKLQVELKEKNEILEEANAVEYPFINVLLQMETLGIKVNQTKLIRLEKKLANTLEELTQEIYQLAKSEFNIKSTQQLGKILFEHLGLKGGKKTKTGFSTNESVLLALKEEHEIIPKVLNYREVQKILSTYVKPLLKLAKLDKNSRIYTSFNQTGTATGRLSSTNPNLQNIPVRSSLGREVREAFEAKEGYKLVSIDYSQIELRLLAHYSKDKALCRAFENNIDIHLATAIELFSEDEAPQKRSFAKSINFGLLYGMGANKLSLELDITPKEAKEIIKNYFDAFPTVKAYLTSIQERVKAEGFVETILKRRRIFDYESANGMQKASFLRESVNTVFQGSCADLIKLSMNKIDKMIASKEIDALMLLQIHDELIFEIKEERVEEVSHLLAEIMENISSLEVPLHCSIHIGDNWGELK